MEEISFQAPQNRRLFVVLTIQEGLFMKKNLYILYGIALLQGMVFYGPIATLYRQAQ